MKTRRWIATCVVASFGCDCRNWQKDIRVVVFKVAQMLVKSVKRK